MTKDEAIKLIKEFATRIKPFYEPKRTDYAKAIDMAIESLSEDRVRIEVHRDLYGKYIDLKHKTEWIPCSERLPKVGQDVLFCGDKWTGEGYMREDGDWFQFRWSAFWRKEEVIAWMPLPKPYEERRKP